MALTFRQSVGFMQSRVTARVAGRSPVECNHFVFHKQTYNTLTINTHYRVIRDRVPHPFIVQKPLKIQLSLFIANTSGNWNF